MPALRPGSKGFRATPKPYFLVSELVAPGEQSLDGWQNTFANPSTLNPQGSKTKNAQPIKPKTPNPSTP